MKIAIVTGDDLRVGGRVRREARALADAGHRVTVHAVLTEGLEPEEDDGDVVIVRGAVDRWSTPGSARPKGLLARLGGAGASDRVAPFARLAPLVDLAIRRDPPEALHAQGLDAAVPALAAARSLGIPCVFGDAGGALDLVEAPAGSGGRLETAFRRLQEEAAHALRSVVRGGIAGAVTTSDALAEGIAHRFGVARPVVVRACRPRTTPRRSDALALLAGTPPDAPLVVVHAPPDDGYGCATAIRGLRGLPADVHLVVLGGSLARDRWAAAAEAAGVARRVRFLDAPAPRDLVRLLASADAAVFAIEPRMPSLRLGLPEELLDCVAAGLPVVASDLPGIAPVVRGHGVGRLVAVESAPDAADVADALRALLDDREAAGACRAAALRAARTTLHWEAESRRLVDLYDRIEGGRRP